MSAKQVTDPVELMARTDYALPAELFVARRAGGSSRSSIGYHRFATAAEAIAFAIQQFSSLRPDDIVMAVDEKRFNLSAIKALHKKLPYGSAAP